MIYRSLITLTLFLLLMSCDQAPPSYTPASPANILDKWQVTVSSTGEVDLARQIVLDTKLSSYLRGSTQLDNAPLLEILPSQTFNECTLIQQQQIVEYNCRLAYNSPIVPTESEATVILPNDYLLRFITDLLGYQPIPIKVDRELSISVPGRVMLLNNEEKLYFPVFSELKSISQQMQSSHLMIKTDMILAPGDLPHAHLQRLPTVQFEPILGFRQ